MTGHDYSHHVRRHRLLTVRLLFAALGTLCVVLGIAGMFLPLLPTTPFLLLAAACYARASGRFYNWLLNHRLFGPTILEWRRHRSIAWRTKVTAIVMMSLTLASSIIFFVREPWLRPRWRRSAWRWPSTSTAFPPGTAPRRPPRTNHAPHRERLQYRQQLVPGQHQLAHPPE